ncbi:hypothetical protein OROHE_009047 [Orobanche hederae]
MTAETEVCKVHALDWANDFPPLGKGNTLEDGAGFQVPSILESNKETKSWTEVVISAPTPFDVKVKTNSNVTVSSIIEVSDSFDVKNGVAKNIGSDTKDVKDVADQTDGKDIAMGSLEGYSADVVDDEEANIDAVTKPFKFLIKVPRCDDRSLQEEISLAKLQVDEKTRLRDDIQAQIEEKRAKWRIQGLDYEKQYDAENKKIKELQAKSRAANDARQAAYAHLQGLRRKLTIKNKHFFNYKDAAAAANSYSFTGNKKALYTDQVEKLMELWNTNNEFRQDYVKCNESSTVRRFGSLDGRSLGRNENQPVLLNYAHEGFDTVLAPSANTNLVSELPVLDLKQETAVKIVTSDDKLPKKMIELENEEVMDKKQLLRKADVVPDKKKTQAEKVKRRVELKAQKEAEEKERLKRLKKNEKKKEKRKEKRKAAAMDANNANNRAHEGVDRTISAPANINLVSEMPTLELKQEATVQAVTSGDKLPKKTTEHKNEKVMNETPGLVMVPGINVTDEVQEQADLTMKAKEMLASEKKNQQAEKAHIRDELIAQKEAEEREKVRLKRQKKKERRREKKKAAAMDANDTTNSCATVPNTKSTVEVSKNALNMEAPTRTTSIHHPPLRSRNKINYRQWMWTGLISFVVYILFWLGNLDVFSLEASALVIFFFIL